MALVLLAILTVLGALRRSVRPALALHVLGGLLAILAMATYEIALPLVALGGATYYMSYRSRSALLRWGVDIGLVVLFLAYRLIFAPLSAESGFLVHRSTGQTISRAGVLLNGAWVTWKDVYAPSAAGTIMLVALAVVLVSLLARAKDFRSQAAPWLVLFVFGLALSAAGGLVYLTANYLYVPVVDSIFNRLNVPGSFGYVAMAVAILGAIYEVLRECRLPRSVATLLLALPIAASTVHQLGISDEQARVCGDVVECGVWRGGSSMLAALALLGAGAPRPMWLFDTYEGMPAPSARDRQWNGERAADRLATQKRVPARPTIGRSRHWTMCDNRWPRLNTPPSCLILSRDRWKRRSPHSVLQRSRFCDWTPTGMSRRSTSSKHLWPRLSAGGVLIIDDYGHWQGAREATDEFFAAQGVSILLHRIDYTGRIAVKPPD
jgi:O-methyltransferase